MLNTGREEFLRNPLLTRKLDKVKELHQQNRRLLYAGVIGAVAVAATIGVVSILYGSSSAAFTPFAEGLVVLYFFLILFLALRHHRIDTEDNVIPHLVDAWKKVAELEDNPEDRMARKKALGALDTAAYEILLPNSQTQVDSVVVRKPIKLLKDASDTIGKKIAYQVEQGDFTGARFQIEQLISALLVQTQEALESYLKVVASSLKTVPTVSRTSSLRQLPETRMGQVVLAILGAVVIPFIVVAAIGFVLGYAPYDYLRSNGAVLIGGVFITFAGLLAWFRQK